MPRQQKASSPSASNPPSERGTVLLTDWLNRSRGSAGRRYTAGPALVAGRRYAAALATEVAVARPDDRTASLEVPLAGRFARFRALVGRDDADSVSGPGCVLFEVLGDGRTLFRSSLPVRPSRVVVRTPPAVLLRSSPEPVDVDVRGVKTLVLVTRYATQITQEAPGVMRATGCVWANPVLVPATGRNELPGNPLQIACLQLAAATVRRVQAPGQPRLPLRLAVAPLSPSPGLPQRDIPGILMPLLQAARVGSQAVFTALDRRRNGRFERELRGSRPDSSARAIDAAVAAARAADADAVLVPLVSAVSGSPTPATAIELRLILVRTPDVSDTATVPNSVFPERR